MVKFNQIKERIKDKSVRLPTLAYIRTKRQKRTSGPKVQFLQNALLDDPSYPKSKLTL